MKQNSKFSTKLLKITLGKLTSATKVE